MNYKICLIILFLSYIISRAIFLLHAPLYNDEAIYLRWIQEFIVNPHYNWLISLSDGKQPLYIWLVSPFVFFISSPLLAGRIASLLFGSFTLLGLVLLSKKITKSNTISLLAGLVYLFLLPSFIYDRTAIYESLLGCLSIWTFLSTINFFHSPTFKNSFILAIFLSLGLLTKTSFIFLFYLLPVGVTLYNYKNLFSKNFFLTGTWLGLAILLSAMLYGPIIHAQNYQIILGKNATFIYPIHDWVQLSLFRKVNNFKNNYFLLLSYLFSYMQIPFIIAIIFSFFQKKYIQERILLFSYFFIPFFALMIFGKSFILAPRYIYFMILFLIPLCAIGLEKILSVSQFTKQKKYAAIVLVLLFYYPIYSCVMVLTNSLHSPLNSWDKREYFNSRGTYISQMIEFIKKQSEDKDILIATDGVLGLLPEAFEITFNGNKNIIIKGYFLPHQSLPSEILQNSFSKITYFVSFRSWNGVLNPHLHLVSFFGSSNNRMYLYSIN